MKTKQTIELKFRTLAAVEAAESILRGLTRVGVLPGVSIDWTSAKPLVLRLSR